MYLQEQAFASGQLGFELEPSELLLEWPPRQGLIVLLEWRQGLIVQELILLPETERQLSLLAPTAQPLTIFRCKKGSPHYSAIDLAQL